MKQSTSRNLLTAVTVGSALVFSLGLAGCGHKAAPPPPVPAPAPKPVPAPTVTLNANPTSIESGSSSTLSWTSSNAVKVELNGSAVDLNGSQTVSPTESTDYQVVATGSDGQTANDSVRVSVTQPPPPPPPPPAAAPAPTFAESVHDAFFDFDKSDIRPDAQQALDADAAYLKANPNVDVEVIGHCDARGSAEYNMALGHRRADAVKNYLVSQGVDASRITTESVGKEDPFCTETTSECYQRNRRGHFVQGQ